MRVGKMKFQPNLCSFSDGPFESNSLSEFFSSQGNSLNEMKINMLFWKGNSLDENQILTMNSLNIDYFVFNCNLPKKKSNTYKVTVWVKRGSWLEYNCFRFFKNLWPLIKEFSKNQFFINFIDTIISLTKNFLFTSFWVTVRMNLSTRSCGNPLF